MNSRGRTQRRIQVHAIHCSCGWEDNNGDEVDFVASDFNLSLWIGPFFDSGSFTPI
jgi:hypothetical protein